MPLVAALVFSGCSLIGVQGERLTGDPQKINAMLSVVEAQVKAADTFYYSGNLHLKNSAGETEFHVLTIADLKAGRLKIEMTHPWGKPLLHLLLAGNSVDLLLFGEKLHYQSQLNCEALERRLPMPLERAVLWTLARAFPVLTPYQTAAGEGEHRLVLQNAHGRTMQILDFCPETTLPGEVRFMKSGARMRFSNFQEQNGIFYARQMGYTDSKEEVEMNVHVERMVFNPGIPEAVFSLNIPSGFPTIVLRDDDTEF